MRKLWLFAAAAAAALAASCSEQGLEVSIVPSPDEESSGEVKVLRACFDDETKTLLSMNAAGTRADVLWESGDKLRVYGIKDGSRWASAVFTTQDGGTSEADFTCSNWKPYSSERLVAMYPESMWLSNRYYFDSDYHMWQGIAIPLVQQAVAGGVASGLNLATAFNDNIDTENLHFKNVLSLIRFRLSGSSVGQVSKVRFAASTAISGDCLYCPETMTFNMNSWYPSDYNGNFTYVELTGPFEAGQDYFIAVAPGTTDGFSMTFFDSENRVIVKDSNKTLEMNRSRIADFGTINLPAFSDVPEGVERFMTHTKGNRPVCIAVVGDGFTEEEQTKFYTLAHQGIECLFDTEPYKTYKDYFNVYVMKSVSNESGASITDGNGNIVTPRDNLFGSKWGEDTYQDISSNFNLIFNYVTNRCPEIINGSCYINEVSILMIINDSRYGGICWNWPDGRCIGHVAYVGNGKTIGWRFPDYIAVDDVSTEAGVRSTTQAEWDEMRVCWGDWRNIVVHEFGGHGIGRLGDEYWYGATMASSSKISNQSWTVPMDLNVSGTYNNVPWQSEVLDVLASGSYVTDPETIALYNSRVGIFQGGDLCTLGRWRSEKISCMIDNRQYFSLWQRMLIVKRIKALSGESFNLQAFYENDVPFDPLRDNTSAGAPANRVITAGQDGAPGKIYPPLPPPRIGN